MENEESVFNDSEQVRDLSVHASSHNSVLDTEPMKTRSDLRD
ncbi:hypothetical protein LINPERHAP2_LOCUS12985, partial [Linum perenne]